jgi:hypothetical protein
MHDGIKPAGPKYLVKASAIRQIAYYQFSLFRHSLTMAATQVIEDDYFVSGLQQLIGNHAADVTRSPCN